MSKQQIYEGGDKLPFCKGDYIILKSGVMVIVRDIEKGRALALYCVFGRREDGSPWTFNADAYDRHLTEAEAMVMKLNGITMDDKQ